MSYKHRHELIKKAAELVKSLGYKCFYPLYDSYKNEKPTYCYITDGKRISYMESDSWGSCIQFSTTRKIGNSCCVYKNQNNREFLLEDITEDLINRTFYQPIWGAKDTDKSYNDWEDFKKNSLTGKLCKEFIEL